MPKVETVRYLVVFDNRELSGCRCTHYDTLEQAQKEMKNWNKHYAKVCGKVHIEKETYILERI